MSESLMTEAATTTEGSTSQDATTTATAAVPDASTQQQAVTGQTADAGQSPEGDAGSKGGDAPTGAPEKYEFQMPDGIQMDDQVLGAFSEAAKELDMSQEAAQKVIDKMGPVMAQRQAEAIKQAQTEWTETSKADKEFGGDKLGENLSVAKKALDKFGSPELRTLLNESGLGNHPEIIRAFYRAGKAISEDSFVAPSSGSPSAGPRDYAASLYPNQQPKS